MFSFGGDIRPDGPTVIGLFDDPERLRRAAEAIRDEKWPAWDCHTPYPIHGLEHSMGLKPSIMPWLTLGAGFFGVAFSKTMQWYMSDYDYPLVIGGKPLFSLPAFVPVTFELFVLFGALATFGGILLLCRMIRWRSPLHDAGVMERVSSDHYAVVLQTGAEGFDEARARALLDEVGAEDVVALAGDESAGDGADDQSTHV